MGKKLRDEDLRLNIIINGDNGRKQIGELDRAIHDANAKLENLRATQKKMEASGDTQSKAYQKLTAQIVKTNKEIEDNRTKLASLRRQLDINTMTISELRKHQSMLNIQLSRMVPGTPQWAALNAELKQTNARLAELRAQSKATGGVVGTLANRVNRYIGLITAGFASFAFVIAGINKARGAFLDYDEACIDAMKTTNLTRDEIEELSGDLKKIDTRTAQNSLLDLVRIGGKLGITGKQDLLEFAKAADIINVSLGRDLGNNTEDAIREIGKLVDIFHLRDNYGLEESMLRTGSAINELGMASTANEGYIVDFTKQVAGIAPMADISIQNTLGLAASLDKLGQRNETAATAIGQTITGMFKRTDAFAKVAKMSLSDFTALLNTDVNEALMRVLEGMSNDGNGLFAVVDALNSVKLEGQRAQQILGSLADNVAVVREQQRIANEAFADGSSAMEEFNVKNTSATAEMEKRKKAIIEEAVALGQQLTPAINVSLSATTWLIKLLGELISFSMRYKTVIIALAATYAIYTGWQKAVVAWKKLEVFWSKEHRVALERLTNSMVKSTASAKLMAAAQNLLAGNLRAAGIAAKAFWAALNPATKVFAVIGLVTGAVAALWSKLKGVSKTQKEINEIRQKSAAVYADAAVEIHNEKKALEEVRTALFSAAEGSNARRAAIKAINDKYGEYLPKLITEKDTNEDIARALREVNTQMENNIRLKHRQTEEENAYSLNRDQLKTNMGDLQELYQDMYGEAMPIEKIKIMSAAVSEYNDIYSSQTATLEQMIAADKDLSQVMSGIGFSNFGKMRFFERYYEEIGQMTKDSGQLKRTLAEIDAFFGPKPVPGTEGKTVLDGNDEDKGLRTATGGDWSLTGNEEYLKARLALTEKYRKGEIVSEEQYKDELLALEIKMLQDRLALNVESGTDRLKLQQEVEDKLIEQQERSAERAREVAKTLADIESNPIAQENARYEEQRKQYAGNNAMLEALEKVHQRKIASIKLDAVEADFKRSEEQYKLGRKIMQNRHRQELLDFRGSASQRRQLRKQQNDELFRFDTEYLASAAVEFQQFLETGEFGSISLDLSQLSEQELTELRNQIEDLQAKLHGTQEGTGDEGYAATSGEGSLFGISQNDWETFFENIENGKIGMDELAVAVQAVGNVFNTLMSLYQKWDEKQSAVEKKQLQIFQKNNDRKKKDYEARMRAGLMTEAQYNSEVETLDAEYDAFQEALALKQAERQKQMNIAQAIMNTALSVTMALAQLGPIAGPIAAGIMAAMGAAEVALIKSTPVVTGSEEGGYMNVKRRQDGKRFKARLSPDKRGFISTPTVLVSEVGGEYVIPASGLQNPSLMPFINTIETARRNGTLRNLNFDAVYPATATVAKSAGGFTSTATDGPPTGESPYYPASDTRRAEELFEKLLKRLDEPMPAYVTMLGRNGLVEMMKKYDKQREKGKL